jgi:hypothetical protein
MSNKLIMTLFAQPRTILLALGIFSLLRITAQDVQKEFGSSKLKVRFQTGINSFKTTGIPESRSQINHKLLYPNDQLIYKQESRTAGLAYEFGLRYSMFKKSEIGIMVNLFRDDDEYFTTLNEPQNAQLIQADTASKNTIKNLQSYLNLGITYDHLIYSSPSGRHAFRAGIATGISFNRTPDRTEYDVFDESHFILQDTVGGHEWRMTHTRFKDGLFIAPSVNYSLRLKNELRLLISISEFIQWHSTAQSLKILDKNSGGFTDKKSYTLQAFQIKFGLEF